MNAPDLPGLPRDDAGAPVFAEPWQARAFALTLALHDRGAFAWTDWAEALGAEIARDPAARDADGDAAYYRAWLRALETLLAARGVAARSDVAALAAAWQAAAEATPHGTPIRLENAAP